MKYIIPIAALLMGCTKSEKPIPQKPKIDTIYSDVIFECKRREGFRDTVYICPAGVKTIGYGQTGTNVKRTTKSEASKILHMTINDLYLQVTELLPNHNRNQHLAVVLLAYNIGLSRLKKYDLWDKIVKKEAVYKEWIKIKYYKSKGKYKQSNNLFRSRRFELWLYEGNFDQIKNQTKETQIYL